MDIFKLRREFRAYLNLSDDKQENSEIVASITSGTQFKGTNLWILVCAILIASLGLNMNSTAVIIGAMLISPLMGPIMGIGLGIGIGDANLIRSSLKNLFIATLFSLLASALYFVLSPINDARSELLARTQPTIYDVMIAFFGGFAGIIATGSKTKGNILPGVAIATALMPPLCTAGYGLATLQWKFLYGALYLFSINAVYIGLATWLGTKVLHLPKVDVNKGEEGNVGRYSKAWTVALLVLFIIPSIVTTTGIVRQNMQEARVSAYIHGEFDGLGDTHLISYEYNQTDTSAVIQVNLLGAPLDSHKIDILAARMGTYGLNDDISLKVVQGGLEAPEVDAAALSSNIMKNVVVYYNETIERLQKENDSLKIVLYQLQKENQHQKEMLQKESQVQKERSPKGKSK
ncbi:MAG: TIGR00341 family protein [Paludibacteraceae bacterium]|nr:TIGR00341 family protein [Paludibacteraceae bacterium]